MKPSPSTPASPCPRCPLCGSEDTRYDVSAQEYLCQQCRHRFAAPAEKMPQRIFISYGHDEYTAFAYQLADTLKQQGYDIFIDRNGIRYGKEFDLELEEGLKWTHGGKGDGLLLLLMTPHSVRRPDGFCLNEIAYAQDLHLRIIPIMLKQVNPPLSIYRLQYYSLLVNAADEERRLHTIQQIVDILKSPALEDKQHTYPALDNVLKPIDFNPELSLYSCHRVGREWLLAQIEEKLAGHPRVLLVTGMPGIGKTTMSTYLYQRMPQAVGYYMFRQDDNGKLLFHTFASTIAFQLASQLPGYQAQLLQLDLKRILELYEGYTLFRKLITEPLSELRDVTGPKVLLVDGLNEAERQRKNAMAIAIASLAQELPDWLSVIVFSQPVSSVLIPLRTAARLHIEADDEANRTDLRNYIEAQLPSFPAHQIEAVVEHAEGSFLYAVYACRQMQETGFDRLPQGMVSFYYDSFQRLFLSEEEYARARHILEWILPASRPVSAALVRLGSGCDEYRMNTFRNQLGAFIEFSADHGVRVLHSSLTDWLSDEEAAGEYWVHLDGARRKMAAVLQQLFQTYLGSFEGLADYKQKRALLEEKTDMKADSQLFPLYLDLLVSLRDWPTLLAFAAWYIGTVPSTLNTLFHALSDWQDQYRDECSSLDGYQHLYAVWEEQITRLVEQCIIRKDLYDCTGRLVAQTNVVYFLKLYILPFLKESFAPSSLQERCRILMRAFSRMECNIFRYESLHEDTLCSCFVDEIREHLNLILQTGKITDPTLLAWLRERAGAS